MIVGHRALVSSHWSLVISHLAFVFYHLSFVFCQYSIEGERLAFTLYKICEIKEININL